MKFEKIFSNVMFQMERLEKIVDITLPGKLRSMRDLLVFLNTYSEEHKA